MGLARIHSRSIRMAFQRRRHKERWWIFRVSAVEIISWTVVIMLVLLAVLFILETSFIDQMEIPSPGRSGKVVDRSRSSVMRNDNVSESDLWESKLASNFWGCSERTAEYGESKTHSNRFLMIATSGGLNQQRTGIIDAVVAAKILNATLIIPKLDSNSFWKDTSNFSDIFNVDWFIKSLSEDVQIIQELPSKSGKSLLSPWTMRIPKKCSPSCYESRLLPVLQKKRAVQIKKFDYSLSNKLPTHLQKLRCRVNFHALIFSDPLLEMGEKLIQRMRGKGRRFIALHLRFEADMLAFSGCYYGGGEKEIRELGALRNRWKALRIVDPEKNRRQGKCPLTPGEVGLMLRALGYGSEVPVYVASGEVYGGEEALTPLKSLFPNIFTKESLANVEELAPFSSFSSRLAALDFIVCDASDAFVANNNGNMAKMLAGRRRYMGHKRTIRPNAKKLNPLFQNREKMTWEDFAAKVRAHQKGFMGEPDELRPGRGQFHEYPYACICEKDRQL